MITVHHLNNSRSQRILWLLEELGLDYEIKSYLRHPETNRAPAELREVHPVGKSPVITDGDRTVMETGAIIEHILDHHGDGRLRPARGTEAETDYLQWLHFAEGSLMLPLLLMLVVGRMGEAAAPAMPFIQGETELLFGFVESHLAENKWFAGDEMSGADIAMSFPLEAMHSRGALGPASAAWVVRMQARDAYRRALVRGGDYAYGPKA